MYLLMLIGMILILGLPCLLCRRPIYVLTFLVIYTLMGGFGFMIGYIALELEKDMKSSVILPGFGRWVEYVNE